MNDPRQAIRSVLDDDLEIEVPARAAVTPPPRAGVLYRTAFLFNAAHAVDAAGLSHRRHGEALVALSRARLLPGDGSGGER